jgi:hypothetical protein
MSGDYPNQKQKTRPDPSFQQLSVFTHEPICPHRDKRKKPPTWDGRSLRSCRDRRVIERTISWRHNWRRFINRREWYPDLFMLEGI